MLELRNITKTFGDVLANDRVSFKVEPGPFTPSSAKMARASRLRCASPMAFIRPTAVTSLLTVRWRQIRTPHDAIALGFGMVHQHFMLVEPMTVAENIVLGAEPGNAASLDLRKARMKFARCLMSSSSP